MRRFFNDDTVELYAVEVGEQRGMNGGRRKALKKGAQFETCESIKPANVL
jgi:hypothetical protein